MKRAKKQREHFDISKCPAAFDVESPVRLGWDTIAPALRQNIVRRVTEIERGTEKYRTRAVEFEALTPYAAIAQARNVTLAQLLEYYDDIEQRMMSDPIDGMSYLWAQLGDGRPFGEFWFNDVMPALARQQSETAHAVH